MPSLQQLPYDLVLNIVYHLDFHDIQCLKLTCKPLHYLVVTRPVYRHLAVELLRRCRALPLTGFQRLSDLSTAQLIRLVNKAQLLEHGWLTRTPQPALSAYFAPDRDGTPTSTTVSSDGTMSTTHDDNAMTSQNNGWYKIVSTPPHEKVDWLSPITASFTLCATKGGRVILWDILRDCALAEWHAGERWELWKCRVEFERRTVYFTMARHLGGSRDDHEMEFKIMQIQFPESAQTGVNTHLDVAPTFSHIRTFMTSGIVMNIFLLDPILRLLSGFVLMWNSTTIGLFVLLDWDKDEYVFIDTMIQCGNEDNWSCIFHDDEIIIHSEGANGAAQYFYPLSLLREHVSKSQGLEDTAPRLSRMLSPPRAKSRRFTFPRLPPTHYRSPFRSAASYTHIPVVMAPLPIISNISGSHQISQVIMTPTILPNLPPAILQGNGMLPPAALDGYTIPRRPSEHDIEMPNPFKYPDWYPESAHFVRQWWPTLPAIPRLSCTVILFACTKHAMARGPGDACSPRFLA
ncbi:hypothetical protein EWM64_g5007 [Hericium alpestre]|uniref:F-box domain-containing protein n=1 Tax=Hericium alpestre TaxID=135208 RepID=A0A4Y9ZVV2_9AGAM|nr:hypothetical protein EWM64_g5007 [Hericium alpestre]